MYSIVYHNDTKQIKEYHEHPGQQMRFRHLEPQFSVWHVDKEYISQISHCHDRVIFENGSPVGTALSIKRHERVKGIAVQTGGLWELPNKEPYLNQNTVLVARFRGLGDILMSWFAVEEYRRQYPERHITYLKKIFRRIKHIHKRIR